MDVMHWISTDVAGVRQKLTGSVVSLVPPDQWGQQADGGGSSLNHLLLHLARHQDLAVNTAIRNKAPLFDVHRYALGLQGASPAAGLSEREDRSLTAHLAPGALLDYVTDVFSTTQRWIGRIGTMALDTVPPTSRRLAGRGQIAPDDAPWLHQMWSGQTVAWLVQWPVIGHGHAHVGEMISVRNRLGYSPF